MADKVRIGSGAGYAGDRWEPAVELAEKGEIDFLAFECLAERTIARENLARIRDPGKGYNPLLPDRIRAVRPGCMKHGVRVITNMGAANPVKAARRVCEIANELGFSGLRAAVVLGDDVRNVVVGTPELELIETGMHLEEILPKMASVNAYLGADAILAALHTGAEVIITGRVSDPSLFLAPILYHLNWSYNDYAGLACGTVAGHLLECAGQVTGRYFADPGRKDVSGLARLGFPFADVDQKGVVEIGKVKGSGGRIDERTCAEQLLYEVHDPSCYITPDCVLDVTDVHFETTGQNRVRVVGARARARTETYKVSVGYHDGYIGMGEISYAGINSVARARLAGEVVADRLKMCGFVYENFRTELIGMESLHGKMETQLEPYEVRLRVAGRSAFRRSVVAIGLEVETLYTNGLAGGAGATQVVRDLFAVQSVLLPRQLVNPSVRVGQLT